MKKIRVAILLFLAMFILAILPVLQSCVQNDSQWDSLSPQTMSANQISKYIKNQNQNESSFFDLFSCRAKDNQKSGNWDAADRENSPPVSPSVNEGGGTSGDYAKTNTQHEGIDEGDIIKVDDNYIYKLSSAGLVIVKIQNEMTISCKIDYDNFVPVELFIFDNKLIVIGGVYENFYYRGSRNVGEMIDCCYMSYSDTKIMVYDLNDRVNLKKEKEYKISGNFETSRLIDGKLVFAVNYNIDYYNNKSYFPKIDGKDIDAKKIDVYQSGYIYNYCILGSIDLDNFALEYSAELGLYGEKYFSQDYLYFLSLDYSTQTYNNLFNIQKGNPTTIIVKINLNSLKYASSTRIVGVVNNRYYADEYNDNLRVLSWVSKWSQTGDVSYTNLYVLDSNLKKLGMITNIAKGERIFSVRFNEEQGSIVTFRQIDPLFKLDLSNPKDPKISEGMKEDGVSTYLQYLNKDTLLGLGLNGDGSGRLQGMKIALYDNSGADAVNVKTINVGSGYAYSEALYNPKAILNDTAKNMFSFAVELWSYNAYWNLDNARQGLAVFQYDLQAENNVDKLIFRGLLSNIDENATYENWYEYYDEYHSYVVRGARIGNKIYTISDKHITSYSLDTLEFVQRLQIAEFKSAAELFNYY